MSNGPSTEGGGGEVLDPDAACSHEDLVGGLVRLRLARPALDTLTGTNGPVRQGDLAVMLVAGRKEAVHSRTLSNAMRFLVTAGLVTRRERSTRNVEYQVTSFGRDLSAALGAADRVARENLRNPEPDDLPEEPESS